MTCPACAATYGLPDLLGDWPQAACRPPSSDSPIPGHDVDIPAWCAVRGAYVWLENGELVSDR